MGCPCNKRKRPNIYDPQSMRQSSAPETTYVWYVGSKEFAILQLATEYRDSIPPADRLPIVRKKI